jgi:hypothetical protein
MQRRKERDGEAESFAQICSPEQSAPAGNCGKVAAGGVG